MKLSTIFVAGTALVASVDAQPVGLPTWLVQLIPSLQNVNTRPSSPPSSPPSPNFPAPPYSMANPNIPSGSTVTASATSYGKASSIVPTIPSATASVATSVPLSSGAPVIGKNGTIPAATGSNSTNSTSGSLVSCAQDAKNSPNAANDATHRCNWQPGYDINTDYDTAWPNTGNTVKYTLTITNGTISPQGDQKIGFLINGADPGPVIEANWGDFLEITVINQLQHNGTSIHWHGFQQKQTNDQDGVGGITECPLAPGDSKTYRFQATQYGTSWYHSHFSGQYGEGVLGPIVIHGPTSYNYDVDLGTVIMSDYFPLTAFQEEWIASHFGPPTATNYLLNGKNVKVDGSAGQRSTWTFQPGMKHMIRLINTSTNTHFKVQIDKHSMVVVAMDFVPINPYRTNELSIGIGQRYDIIVEANQAASNYWFRALAAKDCSFISNDGTGIANGIVSYANATPGLPSSTLTTPHSDACVDEPLAVLKPIVAKAVDSNAFSTALTSLPVGAGVVRTTADTVFQWTIGGISQVIDWSNPTLANAVKLNNVYDTAKHVVQLPNANAWTYWVLQNQFFVPHPMHLHGHDFAILGQGSGVFNAAQNLGSLNFTAPARRDTVLLVAQGWTVIAFKTDNPGAWLMHCHIAWHVSGGLSLQFLERPADIPGLFSPVVSSSTFSNTCANWKTYAATMVYKQSDSGLKKRETVGEVTLDLEVMDKFPERRRDETVVRGHSHMRKHIRRQARHWVAQSF